MTGKRRARPRAARGEPALRLRRARVADAAAIARVMAASIRGLAAPFYAPPELACWSSLPPLYHAWAMTAGGEAYLVAEEGGRIVGYGARRGAEITAVFVHPARAGAGVGARLLRALEARARRAGANVLSVRAALGAVPFYAAMGYRPVRTIRVPLPGGRSLRAVLAKKP